MTARIFFAMRLQPLHLEEVQLYRRLASEEGDHDPYFALLWVNLVDGAHEVDEGAIDDAYALAQLEADLDAGLLGAHLAEAVAHLYLLDGGDDYVEDEVLRIHGPDTVLQIGAGLILVAGVGVNDVPGAARPEHLVRRGGGVVLRRLRRF